MVFETKETLESRVAKLERIIQTIGLVQQEVVSVIAEDNPKLQAHVIAAILAQQENRDGFTEWLNQQANDKALKVIGDIIETLEKFAEAFDTQKDFNITISNKVLELEKKIEDIN